MGGRVTSHDKHLGYSPNATPQEIAVLNKDYEVHHHFPKKGCVFFFPGKNVAGQGPGAREGGPCGASSRKELATLLNLPLGPNLVPATQVSKSCLRNGVGCTRMSCWKLVKG